MIGSRGDADSGRELSRTFKTIDHAAEGGAEGFVTITGGKGTTLRGMAEVCAGVVCSKLGVDEPCRTRDTVLLPPYRLLRRMMATPDRLAETANGTPAAPVGWRSFRVFRFLREDGPSRFETFETEVKPESTVLDGLRWIKIHLDQTLTFRHSCFHASCGTCGVRVNGRERRSRA